MSKKSFARFNAADQALIKAAAKESVAKMRELWDAREKESEAKVKAGGAQINAVEKQPFGRRDEAGLRQVRHRSEAQGDGRRHPGGELSLAEAGRLSGRPDFQSPHPEERSQIASRRMIQKPLEPSFETPLRGSSG
ncbi:hypothetical protein BTHI11S_01853 [Bosea thiooxidans]